MAITDGIGAFLTSSFTTIQQLIATQGYLAIFVLMVLEGSSLPIPSEVVVPLAGYFAAQGVLNLYLAFAVVLAGSIVGLLIDYYIGYFLGKDVVYKHLQLFRVKKETLDGFDRWFDRNGAFAVFVTRFIPEIRALMSFPAGFAKMPMKKFLFWSILGNIVWDGALILFGYYVGTQADNVAIVFGAVGIFVIALYAVFRYAMKRMKKGGTTHHHG